MLPRRLTNFALLIHNAVEKGFLLFLAMFLALTLCNSSYYALYDNFFATKLSLSFGNNSFSLSARDWINDLLMALFFFSVGMEIKRELITGHLSTKEQRLLPMIGALGGVLFPMCIFILFNINNGENLRGWAIPTATDIAFALGVLSLFGGSLPLSLKVFLTALAIIDDLLAVIIIALFYTSSLELTYLWYVGICIIILLIINKLDITSGLLYITLGVCMWVLVMASGVHATLAGVLIGILIPVTTNNGVKIIENIEKNLHPLVSYIIMPVFAFANSGINLMNISWSIFYDPLVLGIGLGLFLGKQLGVFGSVYLLIKLRISSLPKGSNFKQFYGIALICGIGFTMSLFIGVLAFSDFPEKLDTLKIAVLCGSLLSFIFGGLVLKFSRKATTTEN
jgi:NhaA family Na+:H+ antiporter